MKTLPQVEPEGCSGVLDSAKAQLQPVFKSILSTWAIFTGLLDSHAWSWLERSLGYRRGGLDRLNPPDALRQEQQNALD